MSQSNLTKWKPVLLGKLKAEGVKDFQPETLSKVFAGCVASQKCERNAETLIFLGLLKLSEL